MILFCMKTSSEYSKERWQTVFEKWTKAILRKGIYRGTMVLSIDIYDMTIAAELFEKFAQPIIKLNSSHRK